MFRLSNAIAALLGLVILLAEASIMGVGLLHPRVDAFYNDYFIRHDTSCLLSSALNSQAEGELRNTNIEISKLDKIDACFLLRGAWSFVETWGIWSDGKVASLQLPVFAQKSAVSVTLTGMSPRGVQIIGVYVDGNFFGKFAIPNARLTRLKIALPKPLPDDVLISFHIDHPAAPSSYSAANDSRLLGIGLISVDWN